MNQHEILVARIMDGNYISFDEMKYKYCVEIVNKDDVQFDFKEFVTIQEAYSFIKQFNNKIES